MIASYEGRLDRVTTDIHWIVFWHQLFLNAIKNPPAKAKGIDAAKAESAGIVSSTVENTMPAPNNTIPTTKLFAA